MNKSEACTKNNVISCKNKGFLGESFIAFPLLVRSP